MKEHGLTKLRQAYQTTHIPPALREHGWEDLSAHLPRQALPWTQIAKRTSIVAGIFLIGSSTLVAASQPALPGNLLYPLKVVSDTTWAHFTGTYDSSLDRRADEVIKASRISSQSAETATKAYQQALEKAAEAAKHNGTTAELRQSLQTQEEKFQKATPSAHSLSLQQALEETQQTQGEVQGVHTQRADSNQQNGNNNEHGNKERQTHSPGNRD